MRLRLAFLLLALPLMTFLVGLLGTVEAESSKSAPNPRESPYIRVLGTAQDGGFPHAGCSCERCELAKRNPAHGRLVASLALVLPTADKVFLMDVSPDIRRQLDKLVDVRQPPVDRVDRQPVDGVLLTHAHIGHYLGLAFFGYEAIHTTDLPVLATPRMAEYLRTNGPWSQLVGKRNIILREMAPGQEFEAGDGVVVTAVRAPHRDEYADTLGFLISGPHQTMFYLPDTDSWQAWSPPVTEFLREVDVALLDGTFLSADELPGRRVEEIGHPLIEQSMDLLQSLVDDSGLQVYFTHLNHSNPALDADGDARKTIESRGFHILEDGTEIPL